MYGLTQQIDDEIYEMNDPRPHDLLWYDSVQGLNALPAESSLPAWLNPDWPVVMRRAPMLQNDALLPVGLRGLTRSVRCAALLSRFAIKRCITPESLLEPGLWQMHPLIGNFPAIRSLTYLLRSLQSIGLVWGPTGGVGFALATGVDAIRPDSDLDVLVRSDVPLTGDQLTLLECCMSQSECRLDIQIDSGYGGFSLAEWLRGSGSVLLKTNIGPILTVDPWSPPRATIAARGFA